MPSYRWRCQVCDLTNAPELEACRQCACPAVVSGEEIVFRKKRFDAEVSNRMAHVPPTEAELKNSGIRVLPVSHKPALVTEFFESISLVIVGLHFSWNFLRNEQAVFPITEHGPYIEISGMFSSLLASLSMFVVACEGVILAASVIDQRSCRPNYRFWSRRILAACLTLAAVAILVGWMFETIRIRH